VFPVLERPEKKLIDESEDIPGPGVKSPGFIILEKENLKCRKY
jgi:hypothetical protein